MIEVGQKYRRLTVVRPVVVDGKHRWESVCECGAIRISRACDLLGGHHRSCGCAQGKQKGREKTHGMTKTPTHRTWSGMLTRCRNPRNQHYAAYGGRGIKVCPRWSNFENFVTDMGVRPEGTSLDRIDPNGNYEPSNCRWTDTLTQNRNRRNSRQRMSAELDEAISSVSSGPSTLNKEDVVALLSKLRASFCG